MLKHVCSCSCLNGLPRRFAGQMFVISDFIRPTSTTHAVKPSVEHRRGDRQAWAENCRDGPKQMTSELCGNSRTNRSIRTKILRGEVVVAAVIKMPNFAQGWRLEGASGKRCSCREGWNVTHDIISEKNEAHILVERKTPAFFGSQCRPCVYFSLTGDRRILSTPALLLGQSNASWKQKL